MEMREYTFDKNGRVRADSGDIRRSGICPRCASKLEVFRSRRPRSFRWLGVLAFGWPLFFGYSSLAVIPFLEPHVPARLLHFLIIIFLVIPPGLIGLYLKNQPRLIPMECYTCGWRAEIPVAESRAYDPPRDGFRQE